MASPIRPNVLEMQPYSPGKPIEEVQRELGLTDIVKLASNENPLGPSPLAVQAISEAAKRLHLYPDAASHSLVRAIADRYDVEPNEVVVGNGSDEIIHLLGLVTLGDPHDEVLIGDPSFVRYDAAAYLAPSKLIKVPLDKDEKHDLDAMAERLSRNTKLVFIANPNNPTGTIISKKALDRFMEKLPSGALLVLDEAYYEFAEGEPDFPNSVDYLKAGAPIIGMRTFSKAYGLAGIRLGFAFAPAAIIDAIHRAREPFNVNLLAQAAGIAALQDHEHLQKTLESNRCNKARVEAALRAVGADPVPSFTNFVFADMKQSAQPIFQKLLEKGIIVRSGHVLGRPNALRVSIGTDFETDRFVEALESVMPQAVAR